MKYRFYTAADRRQDEIWDYTVEKWGEEQAIRYIKGLHEAIAQAAAGQIVWRKPMHPKLSGIYFFRYENHYVFFRELPNNVIGVISILHENMDLPSRLEDDVE
jgi:plasmid stabilization system protein ParE